MVLGVSAFGHTLAGAAVWLNDVAHTSQTRLVPDLMLETLQALQASNATFHDLLEQWVQHALVSSWSMALVALGTLLSRGSAGGQSK